MRVRHFRQLALQLDALAAVGFVDNDPGYALARRIAALVVVTRRLVLQAKQVVIVEIAEAAVNVERIGRPGPGRNGGSDAQGKGQRGGARRGGARRGQVG
ncbi:hypothetical protein CR152_31395 [Massilia violaceinigra]|uniref:Uncharacterized protein n=1 Tax=Massilia violaceinigra TaxID=2045208 RepID=A0A2D2DU75_9BURK|nr:hypothetical protein CR152_31395 [Massilia violaceinigra]